MFVGLLTMGIMYLNYVVTFLRPLSGNGSGLKVGFFLLTLIGYTVGALIPVANIIPWFIFWGAAVQLYPK